MLPTPSLSHAFAVLLNLAAKTNPQADTTPLEGRSFAIAIDELPQDIAITVENGQVLAVEEEHVADADVIVSGNFKSVLNMIQDQDDGLDSDELYISGKINTARRFQQFLGALGVNWQGFFAQFMDETKAATLADIVEQSLHVAKGGAERLAERMKQFVIHDRQWLVSQAEIVALQRDIAQLHQRLDALAAKLDRWV